MKMNTLINKISELFKEDDTVTLYTYDNKMSVYGVCFSNLELRKIWRIIQQEKILIELNSTANGKVRINLKMETIDD